MRREFEPKTDPGGRPENEDSVLCKVCGNNLIVVLADGLGGQGDGKAASSLACESLIQCGADGEFPSENLIEEMFKLANENILAHQKNVFHMKTTAVYFCTQGTKAVWAHVGDSRLYHVYQNQIIDYTLDHSASQLSVYLGTITREQIPQDAGRSRLIRAMGVEGTSPDIHEPIQLAPGRHAFFICSDGMWEYLTDSDIISCCEKAVDSKRCCEEFMEIQRSRRTPDCDNNTAVVVFVEV